MTFRNECEMTRKPAFRTDRPQFFRSLPAKLKAFPGVSTLDKRPARAYLAGADEIVIILFLCETQKRGTEFCDLRNIASKHVHSQYMILRQRLEIALTCRLHFSSVE